MLYMLFALMLFVASVAIHLSFCRSAKKDALQAKAFIYTAIIFLSIYVFCVETPFMASQIPTNSLWALPFKFSAAFVFILLVPVYLCFYVLTQLTSPSKKILDTIAKHGELSYQELRIAVEQENLILTRLHDLITSGCVRQVNEQYVLTAQGQKIAAILNIMQGILGRKVGG